MLSIRLHARSMRSNHIQTSDNVSPTPPSAHPLFIHSIHSLRYRKTIHLNGTFLLCVCMWLWYLLKTKETMSSLFLRHTNRNDLEDSHHSHSNATLLMSLVRTTQHSQYGQKDVLQKFIYNSFYFKYLIRLSSLPAYYGCPSLSQALNHFTILSTAQ